MVDKTGTAHGGRRRLVAARQHHLATTVTTATPAHHLPHPTRHCPAPPTTRDPAADGCVGPTTTVTPSLIGYYTLSAAAPQPASPRAQRAAGIRNTQTTTPPLDPAAADGCVCPTTTVTPSPIGYYIPPAAAPRPASPHAQRAAGVHNAQTTTTPLDSTTADGHVCPATTATPLPIGYLHPACRCPLTSDAPGAGAERWWARGAGGRARDRSLCRPPQGS
ncbi:hypothetical protein DFH09DRAFT_1317655 [Mycena vulgaris]|nr:hypothetical protein DFH09DRAFT_1317655 [Mycena vulgaris]